MGKCLKQFNIKPHAVYTSLLKRSIDSFKEISKSDPVHYLSIPTLNSWRLNERHYGALVGLSKEEAEEKMGKEKVMEWRRSYSSRPPPMAKEDMYLWKNADWAKPVTITSIPINNLRFVATEKNEHVPESESIQDTQSRVLILWKQSIIPRIVKGETVLVIAHANSIRAMIKQIDHKYMKEEQLREITIPSATPLVYDFMIDNNNNDANINNTTNYNIDKKEWHLTNDKKRLSNDMSREQQNNDIDDSNNAIESIGIPTSLGLTGRFVMNSALIENVVGHFIGSISFYKLIETKLQDVIDFLEVGDGRNDALIIYNREGMVIHSNSTWQSLCGFNVQEIRGKSYKVMIGPLTNKKDVIDMTNRLETGLPARTQMINYRKNGNAFVNKMTLIPLYDWKKKSDNTYEIDILDIPYQWVAHVELTPDLHHVPPLSSEEKKNRKLKTSWNPFI